MDIFATTLKRVRLKNNLTQEEMAKELGTTLRAYQNYEALGVNQTQPRLELLVKMAEILDVTVGYLLGAE